MIIFVHALFIVALAASICLGLIAMSVVFYWLVEAYYAEEDDE